jgi:hypothetical protein
VRNEFVAPDGKPWVGGRTGYALLDNRRALGGRRLGDRLGHIPTVAPLALAAGLERSDRPGAAAGKGVSEEYYGEAKKVE